MLFRCHSDMPGINPHSKQAGRWTHRVAPHWGQFLLPDSKVRNASIPFSFIMVRLLKKLVLYLVLYLLSRLFNLGQGYFGHS